MPVESHLFQASLVAVGGTGVLCLYLWNTKSKERQQEVRLEIKAPNHPRLLRAAGHSLQERLWELVEKQDAEASRGVMSTIFASILFYPVVVLGAQLAGAGAAWRQVPGWLAGASLASFIGAICFSWRAYCAAKRITALRREIRNHKLGLRGEQAVAEVLHSPDVAGLGYFAFHDIPKEGGGNIDHIVLGTAGVFVIETKTARLRKPLAAYKWNRLEFKGRTVHFPWGRRDKRPAAQAEDNAAAVTRWLEPIVPGVVIEPLLVYPGWEVHMTDRTDVKAMSSQSLRYYFHKLPTRLTVQQLQTIYAFFERKCRDVELEKEA